MNGRNYKAPDGTFNHFEMKGGPFEGWVKDLNELTCRIDNAANSFQDMDINDVNGTSVASTLLEGISYRLTRTLEDMKKFRMEAFGSDASDFEH